jgi:glycosyltransferase involved in cell wall biosynthesis
MNHKIMLSSNTAWSIYNFRAGLIRSLISDGYQVATIAPDDAYSPLLKKLGCQFVGLPMDAHGKHLGHDLSLLLRYLSVLRAQRPSIYLGYTIKPNVYGSLAARMLDIPVINNIAGLGTAFIEGNVLTRIVKRLYKFALSHSSRIFFQNAEDQELFIKAGLVRPEVTDRVPGSGIDLGRYMPRPLPTLSGRPFRFLLVARMLKFKGVGEFVEATKIVRHRFPDTEFQLLGFVDSSNSNAFPLDTIRRWEFEGRVTYLGQADDVRPYFANADCVVLPSYREGVPRSLLEAAAMARPIIASDTAGCRDVVDDGFNGLLCQIRNAADLAEKMTRMIEFSPQHRLEMGQAGRWKVESEFDERIVIRKYLDMIASILKAKAQAGRC